MKTFKTSLRIVELVFPLLSLPREIEFKGLEYVYLHMAMRLHQKECYVSGIEVALILYTEDTPTRSRVG